MASNLNLPGPLDYSLVDALKAYVASARRGADYSDTYDQLVGQGIAGGPNGQLQGPYGYRPYSTDAGRLSKIASSGSYQTDPMMQARFVALLKQLGYLPHQAY